MRLQHSPVSKIKSILFISHLNQIFTLDKYSLYSWSLETGDLIKKMVTPCSFAAMAHSNKTLYLGGSFPNKLHIISLDLKPINTISLDIPNVTKLKVGSSQSVFVGSADGCLVKIKSFQRLFFQRIGRKITSLLLDEEEEYLFAGSSEGTFAVFQTDSRNTLFQKHFGQKIGSLANLDDRHIIIGLQSGIHIYNFYQNSFIREVKIILSINFDKTSNRITSICVSPCKRMAHLSMKNQTIHTVDLYSGRSFVLKTLSQNLYDMVQAPRGVLAAGGSEGRVDLVYVDDLSKKLMRETQLEKIRKSKAMYPTPKIIKLDDGSIMRARQINESFVGRAVRLTKFSKEILFFGGEVYYASGIRLVSVSEAESANLFRENKNEKICQPLIFVTKEKLVRKKELRPPNFGFGVKHSPETNPQRKNKSVSVQIAKQDSSSRKKFRQSNAVAFMLKRLESYFSSSFKNLRQTEKLMGRTKSIQSLTLKEGKDIEVFSSSSSSKEF